MKKISQIVLMFILIIGICSSCKKDSSSTGEEELKSRSYKGHADDSDATNFVNVYRNAHGTRLDNCITCHKAGEVEGSNGMVPVNACDYCHYLKENEMPYSASLNPFGAEYDSLGRGRDALNNIKNLDSDGDGFTNIEEIQQLYFPGNEASNPDQPACAYIEKSIDELKQMTVHTQFLLCNTHKQEFDSYATYTGIKIIDLLTELCIDTVGASGITVFAPDGYAKTFSMAQIGQEYPKGIYYTGLDDAGLGDNLGFVEYPDTMAHTNLQNNDTISDNLYLLLAYQRDFENMSVSYIDPVEWRIQGEGPFRIIRPQYPASMPDRGSKYPKGDQYDCNNTFDHSAGDMVRGVTIIRIDPMPEGFEEFDFMNAGWAYLEEHKVVIYGHGVE